MDCGFGDYLTLDVDDNFQGSRMKRVVILLAIFVVVLWAGSKLLPSKSVSSVAHSASAPTPAQAAAPEPAKPEDPLSPAKKKSQQEKWFGAETIVSAKRAVRNSLKDPDSAEFKDVYANYTEEFDVVACGKVNAKNGLGGYTGYKRFVSSGQSVILEGRDDLAKAWKDACL